MRNTFLWSLDCETWSCKFSQKLEVIFKVFEVVLKGFYGGSDRTDHLVLWVAAPSRNVLDIGISECLSKVWSVEALEDVPLGDADYGLPHDKGLLVADIEEKAIEYEDKELVAIDSGRLVCWSHDKQGFVTLGYGPESLNPKRLSTRERLMLADYDVDFATLQRNEP